MVESLTPQPISQDRNYMGIPEFTEEIHSELTAKGIEIHQVTHPESEYKYLVLSRKDQEEKENLDPKKNNRALVTTPGATTNATNMITYAAAQLTSEGLNGEGSLYNTMIVGGAWSDPEALINAPKNPSNNRVDRRVAVLEEVLKQMSPETILDFIGHSEGTGEESLEVINAIAKNHIVRTVILDSPVAVSGRGFIDLARRIIKESKKQFSADLDNRYRVNKADVKNPEIQDATVSTTLQNIDYQINLQTQYLESYRRSGASRKIILEQSETVKRLQKQRKQVLLPVINHEVARSLPHLSVHEQLQAVGNSIRNPETIGRFIDMGGRSTLEGLGRLRVERPNVNVLVVGNGKDSVFIEQDIDVLVSSSLVDKVITDPNIGHWGSFTNSESSIKAMQQAVRVLDESSENGV